MNRKLTLLLVLGSVLLTSCVRTETPYVPPIENAAIEYEWTSGYDTYIDGIIYNDGETFISGVELEIRTYDNDGYIIDYDWEYIYAQMYPGESVYFSTALPVSYASDVEVFINRID